MLSVIIFGLIFKKFYNLCNYKTGEFICILKALKLRYLNISQIIGNDLKLKNYTNIIYRISIKFVPTLIFWKRLKILKNREICVCSFRGAIFLRGSERMLPQGNPRGVNPLENFKWNPLIFIPYSYNLSREFFKTL